MGWRSDLLQTLPPRVSLPVRARFGFSRETELDVLQRFVGRGDHALDIGCHLGLYAYHLLRLNGPDGKVVGFEPQTDLVTYLERAFAPQRREGRFEVVPAALGDVAGEATLTLPVEGQRLNQGRASLLDQDGVGRVVPVLRLDDLDLPRPLAFVKCDVEGYELSVLRGGLDLLRSDEPTLLVEIEDRHAGDLVPDTFGLLRGLGYEVAVYRESDRALARLGPEVADPTAAAAAWAGNYVYNFFFIPPGRATALTDTASIT